MSSDSFFASKNNKTESAGTGNHTQYSWNSAAPDGQGGMRTLLDLEKEYDDHVDHLLKSDARKSVIDVGHAICEGDLSHLSHSLKGNDEKVGAIVHTVAGNLEQMEASMMLATIPGHVIIEDPSDSKAIDIDTKKHTAVERALSYTPTGEVKIDMSSVLANADPVRDFKTWSSYLHPGDLFPTNQGARSDAYSGGTLYGPTARAPYGSDNGAFASPGGLRAKYGSDVNAFAPNSAVRPDISIDAGPGGVEQSQQCDPRQQLDGKLIEMTNAISELQKTKTPGDVLRDLDDPARQLLESSDDVLQQTLQAKQALEQKIIAGIPADKRAKAESEMKEVPEILSRLTPGELLQMATSTSPEGIDKFFLDHPLLKDKLKDCLEVLSALAPIEAANTDVQLAAERKMEAGMMYVNLLHQAGDPRALTVFNKIISDATPEVKKAYLSNSDFCSLGKQVGADVPQPEGVLPPKHKTGVVDI